MDSVPTGINHRIGLYALLLLLFCSLSRITDFFLGALHLPFCLAIVCFFMAIVSRSIFVPFRSPIGVALTAFTFWLIVAVPTSVWRGNSVTLVFEQWSKSFGLFVVAAALLTALPHCSQALRIMAYSFFVASLLGFAFGRTVEGRFGLEAGLYKGSNELATAMVQGCIFWWFMINNPTRSMFKRILSCAALVPLIFILLKTASRAGVLVLCALLVLVFFRYSMQGKIVFLLLSVIGIGAATLAAPANVKQRLTTIFKSAGDEDLAFSELEAVGSSAQRMLLLRRSLELTFQNPLLGVGPGQFAVAENSSANDEGRRGQWLGTHNSYTQVSSEAGIPALLFFVASLFYCWRQLRIAEKIHLARRAPDSAEFQTVAFTLRLAVVSYAIFFCFEHIAYDPFYPVLAGIIVAFARKSQELAAADSLSSAFPSPAAAAQS